VCRTKSERCSNVRYVEQCATATIAPSDGVQPFDDEPENEITMTAFRLLTMDLLVLFHVMNEGTINILGGLAHDP